MEVHYKTRFLRGKCGKYPFFGSLSGQMAIVKTFEGAHNGPQWSRVQQLMEIDGWKSVAGLDVLCVCMEGRSRFLGKKGKQ